jgi:hypothetical protein
MSAHRLSWAEIARPRRPPRNAINTYLPMELLREIFLYTIESNHMKSGQLAAVCRYWRFVISIIAHLWSTLRVGTWTETEQVVIWLQRAFPKKVIIDPQRDSQNPSDVPMFAALQNAFASTDQWHELSISSFPPENLASQLGVEVANPMNLLKMLHVSAGCVDSPSLAHLLNLVPAEAPLCELRLHLPYASSHFLQPHWFPILQNLTVLIVNGRNIYEPFELLPTFTQLQTFEADRLRLPFYEPDTNLPLLCTLRKLQLRACSVQWMAGRQLPFIEDCAILLPRHWEVIQQHEVQLPSCNKLTYHGHPMTTAQYFRAPKMRAMELKSHDCDDRRVCQHLHHLFRVDGSISGLTTLHLAIQCSERVLIKVLKYLMPLQELILSISHPSPYLQGFLESLAAKPSTNKWPALSIRDGCHSQLEEWCSSQIWNVNILPHLKYLGIRCPRGFSWSASRDNFPWLRLVGWTRARLTPPLEHLKVWEGRGKRGDIVVDYISTDYQDKHLAISAFSSKECDAILVIGMATRCLIIELPAIPWSARRSTVLFRQLQHLELFCNCNDKFPILPYLEQIKRLEICGGISEEYSLRFDLPLTRTLQRLKLRLSTSNWMLGRTFKALRELVVSQPLDEFENRSRYERLQVDLPVCTTLELEDCSMDHFRLVSCPNIQSFRWRQFSGWTTFDLTTLNPLHDFPFTLTCLQKLDIFVPHTSRVDSLIHFVFCGAWEQGVWRDIKSAEVKVRCTFSSEASCLFDQTLGHQPLYQKWWKKFALKKDDLKMRVIVDIKASM